MPGGHELEQHTVNPLLFMRGVEFLKNHRRGWDEDFLVKMGEGDGEGGGVGCRMGWGKHRHCSSLIIYGFCSNNPLYIFRVKFCQRF